MANKKEKTITIKITERDLNDLIKHHRETRCGLNSLFECGDIMVSEMHGLDHFLYTIERVFDLERSSEGCFNYERVVE